MDIKQYGRIDTLECELYVADHPHLQGMATVERILDALNTHAGELIPDKIADSKSKPYSIKQARQHLKRQASRFATVGASLSLVKTADPEVTYTFDFKGQTASIGLRLWLVLPMDYFIGAEAKQRIDGFVGLLRALINVTQPVYGWSHSKADFSLSTDPHRTSVLAPKKVYEAYWLNYYGSVMVEEIGREQVLAVPAHHVEEVAEGVLLLTGALPFDYATTEARQVQAKVLAHLRDDISLAEARARLQERDKILAPVERDWHLDIEDLLELTLDDVLYAERQQETARLNLYRPPNVGEWVPVDEAEESDVPDVQAAIDRYEEQYAEQLIALLHKDIPGITEETPDLWPQIDYHFWHFGYAERHDHEDINEWLVPAIGGYLGKQLVYDLGGRWQPRASLDETQVIVGDRAWLPFLRARHYMQSKQTTLDYSLTQFYRVVARYAGRK